MTVSVDAVVYYRVSNPTMATNNIEDYRYSIWIDTYVLMSAPSVHLYLVSFFCPMTCLVKRLLRKLDHVFSLDTEQQYWTVTVQY